MIKNKDKRKLEKYDGIIGYEYDKNDDCWGFNKNEDYLLIHFKFNDCKKCGDFSEKFEKLEPQFIKEYDEYFFSNKDYDKGKIINKIIELKKKYKEKVRLILNMYDIEVDIDNLLKGLGGVAKSESLILEKIKGKLLGTEIN